MKRLIVALLALVMALSAFGIIAMAEENDGGAQPAGCTVKVDNIASQGKIYTPQTFWAVANYMDWLVDGDYSTGAGSECKTRGTNRFLDFGTPREISKIRIYVNYDGEANVSNDPGLSAIKNQDRNFIFVAHPYEESTGGRLCQINFNTKDKTYVEFTSADWNNRPVQTFEIWNDGYDASFIIYEIEVFSETGSHAWELDKVTTNPTCTEDGEGTYKCECGATKTDVVEATGHAPNDGLWLKDTDKGTHYNTCLNGCGLRVNEEPHDFEHNCDTDCDVCGATRTVVGHQYASDCDETCENCQTPRIPLAEHSYSAACVAKCSNCENIRSNPAPHTWDNKCDGECNVCKLTRTPEEHRYSAVCDDSCDECGLIREDAQEHVYYKECTVTCNICGVARETYAEHKYSADCTDATCNVCGFEREVASAHSYDNLCDPTCNNEGCSHKRKDYYADHLWSNACDGECNECGYLRTPDKHIYGAQKLQGNEVVFIMGGWETRLEATTTRTGVEYQYCKSCNAEQTRDIPMLEDASGLSQGAIIALVVSVSSVVILGCTGIGVYSMIIKPKLAKKKLEALEAQKRAEAEADDEEYDDEEYDDEEYEDDEDSDSQE